MLENQSSNWGREEERSLQDRPLLLCFEFGLTKPTFSNEGQQRRGFVNRITKRATVLVQDKKGTPYSDGKRYVKYYVPLNQLRRAS